jgi:hypothetical protein
MPSLVAVSLIFRILRPTGECLPKNHLSVISVRQGPALKQLNSCLETGYRIYYGPKTSQIEHVPKVVMPYNLVPAVMADWVQTELHLAPPS